MTTIKLRKLPNVGLGSVYAMEEMDGRYHHYTIPFLLSIADPSIEKTLLETFFTKQYGREVEVEIEDASEAVIGEIKTVELPEEYFTQPTLEALKKVKTTSTLYQYNRNVSNLPFKLAQVRDKIAYFIDTRIVAKINRLLCIAYGINSLEEELSRLEFDDRFDYLNKLEDLKKQIEEKRKGKFFIPAIRSYSFVREVALTHYLILACEEEDLPLAIAEISKDLDLMVSNKLIMGHLSMPFMSKLSNTVGNGKRIYAVGAFPILDPIEISNLLGIPTLNRPPGQDVNLLNIKLGINSLVNEGGINYYNGKRPYENLVSGTTSIYDSIREDQHKAVVDSYNDQRRVQDQMEANIRANLPSKETLAAMMKK